MASVIVSLQHAVKGAELMTAVEAVAEQNGKEFHTVHDYVDGDTYQIGQVAERLADYLRVSPAGDEVNVRPEASYDKVIVATHQWQVQGCFYDCTGSRALDAVCLFAKALELQLFGANLTEESSGRPMSVTIRGCCDCTPWTGESCQYCLKDGENPPSRIGRICRCRSIH